MDLIGEGWAPESRQVLLGVAVIVLLIAFAWGTLLTKSGSYWIQAYMSGADVSMKSLVVMSLLKIDHRMLVTANPTMRSPATVNFR